MDQDEFPSFEGVNMVTVFNGNDFFHYPKDPVVFKKVRKVVDDMNEHYPLPEKKRFSAGFNKVGIIVADSLEKDETILSYRQTLLDSDAIYNLLCVDFDLMGAVSDDEDDDKATLFNTDRDSDGEDEDKATLFDTDRESDDAFGSDNDTVIEQQIVLDDTNPHVVHHDESSVEHVVEHGALKIPIGIKGLDEVKDDLTDCMSDVSSIIIEFEISNGSTDTLECAYTNYSDRSTC